MCVCVRACVRGEGGVWGACLPGWVPGCRKPARCHPVLSGTHPWLDGNGYRVFVGFVVSITCRGYLERGERERARFPQRGHTMGETKFALYLGAVLSTLLRVFVYLFLRLVRPLFSFLSLSGCILQTVVVRYPSDGLNTCCPVSIAPISQHSLSHPVVFPSNRRRILRRVHPPKRRIARRRRPLVMGLLRLQTRQATKSVPPNAIYYSLTTHHHIHRPTTTTTAAATTRTSFGNCYFPFPPLASRQS